MEKKFKNLNCAVMTHDKWGYSASISGNTRLAKTVFEFLDI